MLALFARIEDNAISATPCVQLGLAELQIVHDDLVADAGRKSSEADQIVGVNRLNVVHVQDISD